VEVASAQGRSRSAVMSEAAEYYLERLETQEMIRQLNELASDADPEEEARERAFRLSVFQQQEASLNARGLTWARGPSAAERLTQSFNDVYGKDDRELEEETRQFLRASRWAMKRFAERDPWED